ncbi:MAG TPA: hypothetical protein VLV16_13200 [Gemmatimonadales bacterium]|nr:hypothetical protein [Gemmatimonadales bacterium]
MRHAVLCGAAMAALVAVAPPAAAQGGVSDAADKVRTMLGITVSASGTDRDTLGLLVSTVTPRGLADLGGIAPGNRLAQVNTVSLRIAPADVGRRESEEGALHRLAQEVGAVQPGDSVKLGLFGGGRYRTVTIQTPRPATPAKAPEPPAVRPLTLLGVVDGMSDLRVQLDRLTQDSTVTVPRDTLVRAERELGALERRLRAAAAPRPADASAGTVPGLQVAVVSDELKDYFGEGSDGGFLVVACDSTWAPLRKGDVILRLNGEPATLDRLRDAVDPGRQTRIDLLRRKQSLTVTLHAWNANIPSAVPGADDVGPPH